MTTGILYLMGTVILTVSGHVLIKNGISSVVTDASLYKFLASLFQPKILVALVLIAIAPILYILALSIMDLHVAFLITSITYPLVSLASKYFLGENIGRNNIRGMALIFIGIMLVLW